MPIEIVQIDAFTDVPFRGNPAAVCLLDEPQEAAWMQEVAREMNLSETAFLLRRDDGGFDLRWFTPAVEVELCGHATLAAAHFLWQDGYLGTDAEARFHTASGWLSARLGDGGWIVMDFPAEPPRACEPPAGLLAALGVEARWVGRNRMDVLVEVADAAAVRGLRPDLGRLRTAIRRGVIVTAAADDGAHDFVSRFFAPAVGVGEDPVTGSAHCCLGPYWAARLGRDRLAGYQASARGGTVRTHPRGDRVELAGQAVAVLRARLVV
ncbi:MAG: PhzF family phenazine biosynthesis protein [Acidobacteria bacterium]|nr:MAG: PhzF family phenazine biosynthesis protein [Acidobacteriota bacterium]